MRISTLLQYSSCLSMLAGFLFTACGSYQSASYYSDGIYSSDNVIVVRRNKPQVQTNAYSQYFDEKAKQYNWNDNNDAVALTDVDSLNQGKLKNYQSKPNWGGGNKTTQIIIQNNPPPFYGAGWGFGNWNYGYYNPYAWNNFAWGFNNPWRFNRWNRLNRWGWGYNYPFFSPFDPYFGNAFYYGNPYFYGGGYWNSYALNNRYWNRFDRRNQRNAVSNNRRVYSSSYRGQASSGGQRSTVVTNRSASTRNNATPSTNSKQSSSLSPDEVVEVPNLVDRGRTASVRNRQNNNENDALSRRQRTANEAQKNRSQIDQVIRSLQNRGYNIQVINDTKRAREFSRQNPSGSMRNNNSNTNYSSGQEKRAPSSRRSYSNESNNNSSHSSSRSSRSNYSSSPSRSFSAPAKVSSGGGRSSSGGSSSGRSAGGRRQ